VHRPQALYIIPPHERPWSTRPRWAHRCLLVNPVAQAVAQLILTRIPLVPRDPPTPLHPQSPDPRRVQRLASNPVQTQTAEMGSDSNKKILKMASRGALPRRLYHHRQQRFMATGVQSEKAKFLSMLPPLHFNQSNQTGATVAICQSVLPTMTKSRVSRDVSVNLRASLTPDFIQFRKAYSLHRTEDDPDAGEFMVQCETCKAWQHGLCMGYRCEGDLPPDDYHCEQCRPDLHVEILE
jgi:hypothetical protein